MIIAGSGVWWSDGAAALQAAVFSGVRAGVDRAGARAFERTTGVWPGEKEKDPA